MSKWSTFMNFRVQCLCRRKRHSCSEVAEFEAFYDLGRWPVEVMERLVSNGGTTQNLKLHPEMPKPDQESSFFRKAQKLNFSCRKDLCMNFLFLFLCQEYGHSSKRLKVRHGLAKGKVETQKYSKADLLKMTDIELSHHLRPRITRRTSKSKISRNLGAAQTKYTMSVRRNVLNSARKSRRLIFSSKKQLTVWAPPMRKNGLPHPNRLALVVATPLKEREKNFEELLTPLTQNQGEAALGRQTQRCLRSKVKTYAEYDYFIFQ